MVEAQRPRARELERLTDVSRALTYAGSLEAVLDITVDSARDLLDSSRAVLMLKDDDEMLRIRAHRGLEGGVADEFGEPLDETLIRRLSSVFGEEAERRFLGVPLVVDSRVTGLLAVLRSGDRDPVRDEWLLSALADQVSVALDAARRQRESSRLSRRVRDLEEQEERQEQALRIMGHDARTPLNAVRGYLDLVKQEVYGPVTDQQEAVFDRILSVTGHLETLVEDALQLSRLQAGQLEVASEPVRVSRAVDDARAIVELAASEADVTVRTEVPAELVARADESRLRQVLVELLKNAVRHTPAGGAVGVTGARKGDAGGILVRISDEGPGVDESRIGDVFEPYRKGDDSSTGSGLGLAISKGLAELMGGDLVLESPGAGGGAIFVLTLPSA